MAGELIQIIYDESQRSSCYPFAKIYFNEPLTIYFENSCIVELASNSKADKIAVCSWKLKEKLKYYIGRPREITQDLIDSNYDVLSFTKNTEHHQMFSAGDKWHPGFREILTEILKRVDINVPHEVRVPIYQNHFSATCEIYQDYIKTYLKPCIEVIENDIDLKNKVLKDSNYSKLDKNAAKLSEMLMKKIGIDYYPLCPFIFERLFSVYVHNRNINVTHL